MKKFSIAALVIGAVFALVAIYIVIANPDLNSPFSSLPTPNWIPLYDIGWRIVLGAWAFFGSALLAAGWIASRAYPALAWLGMLLYVLLVLPVFALLTFAPTFVFALVALIFTLVAVPVGAALIAAAIARGVRARRGSAVAAS